MTSKKRRNDRVPKIASDIVPRIPRERYAQLLGDEIAYARRKVRLTQTEVADRLDVSTSTISAVERGKMLPGLPLLLKIGVAINTTASELVAALEENLDLN